MIAWPFLGQYLYRFLLKPPWLLMYFTNACWSHLPRDNFFAFFKAFFCTLIRGNLGLLTIFAFCHKFIKIVLSHTPYFTYRHIKFIICIFIHADEFISGKSGWCSIYRTLDIYYDFWYCSVAAWNTIIRQRSGFRTYYFHGTCTPMMIGRFLIFALPIDYWQMMMLPPTLRIEFHFFWVRRALYTASLHGVDD